MKRFLLLAVLLTGCGQSLTEMQAQREELRRTAIRLNHECGLLDTATLPIGVAFARKQEIKAEVDSICGDKYVGDCRDEKKEQLAKAISRLGELEKRIEQKVTQ